jgi:hypothetical protein
MKNENPMRELSIGTRISSPSQLGTVTNILVNTREGEVLENFKLQNAVLLKRYRKERTLHLSLTH